MKHLLQSKLLHKKIKNLNNVNFKKLIERVEKYTTKYKLKSEKVR